MGRKKPAQSRAREAFIAEVRRRMAARGITQEELGTRLGVTQPAISRLLSGTYNPSLDLMESVARALDCELQVALAPRT
ncbi:MAG: helix-turn-helix transcriptional regulator [Planctomycetes bacterium]|nr:helix-turn-helix transcriptional regulator [Planctomycetota bacterium]